MNLLLQAQKTDAFGEIIAQIAHEKAISIDRFSICLHNAHFDQRQQNSLSALCHTHQIDYAWLDKKRSLGDFKVLAFDMDSTLVTNELIDEIGNLYGCKEQVAHITAAAMRGELNYAQSLRERVNLLKGVDIALLERVKKERMHLSPGVANLIQQAKTMGLKVILITGGFTYFANTLRDQLGLDAVYANQFAIENNQLSGEVIGEIIDAEGKAKSLTEFCQSNFHNLSQTIAIGDGANDLKMLGVAEISVAWRAKPVVQKQAKYAVNYMPLDSVLRYFVADYQP